jgi:hypothetical protein
MEGVSMIRGSGALECVSFRNKVHWKLSSAYHRRLEIVHEQALQLR